MIVLRFDDHGWASVIIHGGAPYEWGPFNLGSGWASPSGEELSDDEVSRAFSMVMAILGITKALHEVVRAGRGEEPPS